MTDFLFLTKDALGPRWSLDRVDGLTGMKLAYSPTYFEPPSAVSGGLDVFANLDALSPFWLRMSAAEVPLALSTGVADAILVALPVGSSNSLTTLDAQITTGFYVYTVEADGTSALFDVGNGGNYLPPGPVEPPPTVDPGINGYAFDLLVHLDLGVDALSELDAISIAVVAGSSAGQEIAGFFRDKLLDYQPLVYQTADEARNAYEAGIADAWGVVSRGGNRFGRLLDEPADHLILQADGFASGPPFAPSYIVNIALVYEAGLGREADSGGLNYWIEQALAGLALDTMAGLFLDSAEFTAQFGDDDAMTNAQFVDVIYRNVLGRPGEPAGQDYWVGAMNGGTSREGVLVGFAASAENSEDSRASSLQQTSPGHWDFW
ncbi:DUF4214 domain-containing protein [Mesorhizobium sp. CAU 1741]|uniref:DUF4214 domain-containing protein n=1 Tax=Mesorhizobium sp. CAU 1741 TaxID=3140366 RepID=UPI00325A4608